MGQLLTNLLGTDPSLSIVIDLNARPLNEGPEMDLFNEAEQFFQGDGGEVMELLKNYEGCAEQIRNSMASPSDQGLKEEAYRALRPNVQLILRFQDISHIIESLIPRMLSYIQTHEGVESNEALFVQFGKLLEYVLDFDQEKMTKPAIQNDFSFYRRILGQIEDSSNAPVDSTQAGVLSMWIAQNTPIIYSLTQELSQASSSNPQICGVIATIANACCGMVSKNVVTDAQSIDFCLKVMTMCIVLYDRIYITGVFRSSPVQMKRCITTLKKRISNETLKNKLINVIKYTSSHFNDPTTPDSISSLLED